MVTLATDPIIWEPGMVITPNFYHMPEDVYHSQSVLKAPAISYSIAKTIVGKSPRHAWACHPKLGNRRKESTPSMEGGVLAHKLILGVGQEVEVCDYDTWRTKAAQEHRDRVRESGRLPILRDDYDDASEMVTEFENQVLDLVPSFYEPSCRSEMAAYWYEGDYLCQSLFDRVNFATGEIFDIKRTSSTDPGDIERLIARWGYDIQAMLYPRAVAALCPGLRGRITFTFLFVEDAYPYAVTPVRLSGAAQIVGDIKIERAFKSWGDCLESGDWPYYANETIYIDPPRWSLDDEMSAAII